MEEIFNRSDVSEVFQYFLYLHGGPMVEDVNGISEQRLGIDQLGNIMRVLGLNPTEAEVNKGISNLHPETCFNLDMLLPVLNSFARQNKKSDLEELIDGLRTFDRDGNGFINSGTFKRILTNMGDKLSEEEAEDFLTAQEDEDGNVNYETLIRNLLR